MHVNFIPAYAYESKNKRNCQIGVLNELNGARIIRMLAMRREPCLQNRFVLHFAHYTHCHLRF